MNNCIFCKIRDREIPKEFTYEDPETMVFPDINPRKPVHLLVVAKKHIEDFLDLSGSSLEAKINEVVRKIVKQFGLDKGGFRLVIHGGGAQIIRHFHVHILGPMGKAAAL